MYAGEWGIVNRFGVGGSGWVCGSLRLGLWVATVGFVGR